MQSSINKNPVHISFLLYIFFVAGSPLAYAAELGEGYWTKKQAQPILDKTLRVHLSPSLDALTAGERDAVQSLLKVGQIMHGLYESSRHRDAIPAYQELMRLDRDAIDPERTSMLRDLYRMSRGPVITTLQNERVTFLPVADEAPGKNVYPPGIEKESIEHVLSKEPALREPLLHLRSVVRQNSADNLGRDLEVLRHHPELSLLHSGLRERLLAQQSGTTNAPFYAVPYSVAYADELLKAYRLLHDAANSIHIEDAAFARYLRNRARDLLADDYEAGDASWVTGRFRNLNAQIGSYETYDDQLYGVKSFFGLSLLIRDHERSAELAGAIGGLQAIEESLPYESSRKIREDIPVGVYNVIADFGQTRGTNTATILPNESFLARQYGRTILLRGNILTHPQLFEIAKSSFDAAVHANHHVDLTPNANLYRTLWHEIGHYLGADRTEDGRELGVALEDASDLFEEMKSDLVSLYSVRQLQALGYYTKKRARAVYASGILRVLQKSKPRREQPYQTMQLMQWNWFLEKAVLEFDTDSRTLRINYDRYHDAVATLLAEVLSIQQEGNRDRAERFVHQYTSWEDDLHNVIATNMKANEVYRYSLVTYAALGDERPLQSGGGR